MATPSDPVEPVDDPSFTIYLDAGSRDIIFMRSIPRSKLAKHSGFFRAIFQHNFAETKTNQVILHDDNQRVLARVLSAIELGMVSYQRTNNARDLHGYQLRNDDELDHMMLTDMLQLLSKYDCLVLHAQALGKIARCFKGWMQDIALEDVYFEDHYEPIVTACGGVYPERLYECFAYAWTSFAGASEPSKRMTAIVEATPALAFFLAKEYCSTIIHARRAREAANVAMDSVLDGKVETRIRDDHELDSAGDGE